MMKRQLTEKMVKMRSRFEESTLVVGERERKGRKQGRRVEESEMDMGEVDDSEVTRRG